MFQKFRFLVYALVLSALALLGYRVYQLLHRLDEPRTPSNVAALKSTEQEKFMVTQNHVTTIKRGLKGNTVVSTEYVPNRAVITLNKDGSVSVKNQEWGLTCQPQLGFGYASGFRIAPNLKLAYLYRLGLNTGISFRPYGSVDPRLFVALSYAVVSNTAVFVGLDHKQAPMAGINVKF